MIASVHVLLEKKSEDIVRVHMFFRSSSQNGICDVNIFLFFVLLALVSEKHVKA